MPKVFIENARCKGEGEGYYLNEADLARLTIALSESVARALTVPGVKGAELTPEHVSVKELTSRDLKGGRGLSITVFADFFEERERDLKTVRVPKIKAAIKAALPDDVHGSVYVHLGSGGYAAF